MGVNSVTRTLLFFVLSTCDLLLFSANEPEIRSRLVSCFCSLVANCFFAVVEEEKSCFLAVAASCFFPVENRSSFFTVVSPCFAAIELKSCFLAVAASCFFPVENRSSFFAVVSPCFAAIELKSCFLAVAASCFFPVVVVDDANFLFNPAVDNSCFLMDIGLAPQSSHCSSTTLRSFSSVLLPELNLHFEGSIERRSSSCQIGSSVDDTESVQ